MGIVQGDIVPPHNNSYQWPGSYGWVLGCNGNQGEVKARSYRNVKTLVGLTKQGDEVKLILDFDAAKLSLHLTSGNQFYINIPKNKTWKLNVNFYGANDKIRIIN